MIDLHRMIDHQIDRHQRLDDLGVLAHAVRHTAHGGKIGEQRFYTWQLVVTAIANAISRALQCFKEASESNIRTALSRRALTALLRESGWRPGDAHTINAGGLQDADWEIQHCLKVNRRELDTLAMPDHMIGGAWAAMPALAVAVPPLLTVSQPAVLLAVHSQPSAAVTANDPLAASLLYAASAGEIPMEHGSAAS